MGANNPSFEPYEGKEPYIFVSYSSLDNEVVIEDLNKLDKMGFRIWYDRGIKCEDWRKSLDRHITDCKVFLIFVSKNSLTSEFVSDELELAKEIIRDGKSLIIFPVLMEQVKNDSNYSSLKKLQGVVKSNKPTIDYYLELQRLLEIASSEIRFSPHDRDSKMLGLCYLPTPYDIYPEHNPEGNSASNLTRIVCEKRRIKYVHEMDANLASYKIENIFQLTSDKTKALQNFESFVEFKPIHGKPYNLVSLPLDIGETYIAPLRLINGLITRLDENWPPLVNSYGKLVTQRKTDLLDDLHYFIEFCWLAWGLPF